MLQHFWACPIAGKEPACIAQKVHKLLSRSLFCFSIYHVDAKTTPFNIFAIVSKTEKGHKVWTSPLIGCKSSHSFPYSIQFNQTLHKNVSLGFLTQLSGVCFLVEPAKSSEK